MAALSPERHVLPPKQEEQMASTLGILAFLGVPLMQAARSAEEEVAALCKENQRLHAQLVALSSASRTDSGVPISSVDYSVLPGSIRSSPHQSPRMPSRSWMSKASGNCSSGQVHFEESAAGGGGGASAPPAERGESKVAFVENCSSVKSYESHAAIHEPPRLTTKADSQVTTSNGEEADKSPVGMAQIVPTANPPRIGATSTTLDLDHVDKEGRFGRGRSRCGYIFERGRSRARIERAVTSSSVRTEETKKQPESPRRGNDSMQFKRSGDTESKVIAEVSSPRLRRRANTFNMIAPAKSRKAVQTGVFANVDAMKEKIRLAVGQKQSTVFDLYKEHGWAQYIGRSSWFENCTLCVILANALWMGASAQWDSSVLLAEADWYFLAGESIFCAYFVFEWIIRFNAFASKKDCVKDKWLILDTVLMWVMVIDTWILVIAYEYGWLEGWTSSTQILQMARLVRLTRMARMAKVMRALPELMVLIKGMRVACRSVVFTLLLLMIIIYVFSVVLLEMARGTELEAAYFSSLPRAMATLLVAGAMPDVRLYMEDMYDEHIVFALVFVAFVLLASLTVMNMLIGVLCETVSVVSAVEKEHMDATYITHTLTKMMAENGIDSDAGLSKDAFLSLLEVPESAKAMQRIGVDVIGLVDYTDMLFEGNDEISLFQLMDLLMQLRGSNTTTVKDIVELRRFLCDEILGLEVRLEDMVLQSTGQERPSETNYATEHYDIYEADVQKKRSTGYESSIAMATVLRRDRRMSFAPAMNSPAS